MSARILSISAARNFVLNQNIILENQHLETSLKINMSEFQIDWIYIKKVMANERY